ncbi:MULTISPECIES: ion transporter [unclassified Streptomyces]|uniref:ion transporter n=1 Tax=unclassified Streptomyces TaxID=2593676 RepID=UPI0005ED0ED4|nr:MULTISPECIES: ion transporter [unclassified Streptomyces]APU42841.1 voltage-gated sodium channel [Streptomyces sp. TN58]KJK46227.1 voltage-gated sodium channel [Streptomyces sp. NRRL F-4428]
MTDPRPAGRGRMKLAARCRVATEAPAFGVVVFCVILLNAALMGVETYSGLAAEHQRLLWTAEHCCLALFTVEMVLRAGAFADRPKAFFRDPWNLFDLAVVASAFVPFVRENTTLLRLLRLARVLRTARFLPHLRILLIAVGRSLPGTASFLFVGGLVLYVYAMVGWVCFAESDPGHYGSVGRAMLTLFLLTTLDGLTDAVRAGLEISRLSIVYYASYALLASFVLVNVLIGVVLNSLDEAREIEDAADRERKQPGPPPGAGGPDADVRDRIAAARRALDELEASLPAPDGRPARRLETSPSGS